MKLNQYLKNPFFLFFLMIFGISLESKEVTPATNISPKSQITWLTVTKVKKPWFAWRGLVSSKMEKSIPEYQSIAGLEEKFYSFWEGTDRFGGIYFWRQKSDADAWFQQSWFDRTEKKYGEKGVVDSYSILNSFVNPSLAQKGENLYAILSYRNIDVKGDATKEKSLVYHVSLIDSNQKKCYLTIWNDESSAMENFSTTESDELFYIPVFFRK
jgi:hypothetical protein